MNYRKIYTELVLSRQLLKNRKKGDGIYYEEHHILPRCLGGSNNKENLVLLTAREHLLAHLLLTECYESIEKSKMIFALRQMLKISPRGPGQVNRKLNLKQYEFVKKLISKNIKGKSLEEKFGEKIAFESRKKIREARFRQTNIKTHPVLQLNKKGEIINEFNSVTEAIKFIGFSAVRKSLKDGKQTKEGSYWKYKDEKRKYKPCEKLMGDKNGSKKPESRKKISKANLKRIEGIERNKRPAKRLPVLQFSLSNEFIKEHISLTEASIETDIKVQCIWGCCKGNNKSAGGYIWKYK